MILSIFFFWFEAFAADPFWKDPKYITRIHDQKCIAVKASTDDEKKPAIMDIEGAAQVNAPSDFVFKACQEYQNLKDVASNFEEIHYYPEKKRLFLHASAMG